VRRKWILTTTAAGAVLVGGLAVAGPALAEDGSGTSAVERITEALAGLVDDGSITQAQADEVAATLAEAGLGGPHGHGRHGPGLQLSVAAETLGMSEDELREALAADGATLADVAEEQGVAVPDLVDALVAAGEERIAGAVEDGRLTQEEADQRLADLEARITERVESPLPDRPGRHHGD
jgi:hypothetical protein